MKRWSISVALTLLLGACSSRQAVSPLPLTSSAETVAHRHAGSTPIQHVIIILQENRTPDYLFQGVPGADIAKSGLNSKGQTVPLHAVSLAAGYDLPHGNPTFFIDYDGGKMDGFDQEISTRHSRPYGYAPASEVAPYFQMATQYVFADRMFQTNESGSFPSHQYIVSGTASAEPTTSDDVSDNGFNISNPHGTAELGCDAPPTSAVHTIDPNTGYSGPTPFPCFERPVLSDLLDTAGISWRFYQHDLGVGYWHPMDAIRHVRYGPDYANVISPSQTILTDIATGGLPGVSWVMPAAEIYSDHALSRSAKGPSWVAAIVNAVGQSQYWNSTAVLILWDDWGGWYDHVAPQLYNHYELGFRVPLVVISPYAKTAYVSHVPYEFGSVLKFVESTFGLPSLQTTDARANDLDDAFDYSQSPRAFTPINAPPFVPSADTRTGSPNIEDTQ